MSQKTNEIDFAVLGMLSDENYYSILDLAAQYGVRHGTLRGSLARLLSDGRIRRRWVGNQLFIKYQYTLPVKYDTMTFQNSSEFEQASQ